jgi:cytochrome c553
MSVTMQKYLVAFLSLALFAALMVAGSVDVRRQAEARKHAQAALDAMVNPQLARGRIAFMKYSCNSCHNEGGAGGILNVNAEGGGHVNSLQHVFETYTTAELAEKIRTGVPVVGRADPTGPEPPLHMPPFRDLISGAEMNDLVAYLMSLRPPAGTPKAAEW